MANGQPTPIIGFLNSGSSAQFADFVAAFQKGLREAGYNEGSNVTIEYKWADGDYDQLAKLANELVSQRVNVIAATGGIVSARAAMKATSSIPILFISGVDPRMAGLVNDLANPSGNASGVNVRTTELMSEGLKHLRKMAGNPEKVAVLVNPRNFVAAMERDQAKNDNLIVLTATNEAELTAALASAVDRGAGALLITADPVFTTKRELIIQFASDHKIPTAYPWSACVSAGGLCSYGTNLSEAYEAIGTYAATILNRLSDAAAATRGAAIGLPVITLEKREIVINHATAARCKVKISDGLPPLARLINVDRNA